MENDNDLIPLGALEVGLDKFVAPSLWRLDDRSIPCFGLLLDPALELLGNAAQHLAADRIDLPVAAEKADHPLGLLKRLDEAIEQDPVKTPVTKADAVFVVLVEAVHRWLS